MTYPGGKGGSGVAQQIINQIPPHRVYIEAFLGSGTILRTKLPASSSIGIDSDAAVISQWGSPIDENSVTAPWIIPPGTIVRNCDAISFLSGYDWQGDEFVYCDPPYLFDVRSTKRQMYNAEFGDVVEHEQLLDVLTELPCMVMISGYFSKLYEKRLQDWRTINFKTIDRAGNIKTEWLWMNYSQPQALHDYRFLGQNFRERERITRIRKRWVARIQRMDPLERLMLSAAIAESSDDGQYRQK